MELVKLPLACGHAFDPEFGTASLNHRKRRSASSVQQANGYPPSAKFGVVVSQRRFAKALPIARGFSALQVAEHRRFSIVPIMRGLKLGFVSETSMGAR